MLFLIKLNIEQIRAYPKFEGGKYIPPPPSSVSPPAFKIIPGEFLFLLSFWRKRFSGENTGKVAKVLSKRGRGEGDSDALLSEIAKGGG